MPVEIAGGGEKLVTEPRMLAHEILEDFPDSGPVGRHRGLATRCRAEDGWQANINWHWVLQTV